MAERQMVDVIADDIRDEMLKHAPHVPSKEVMQAIEIVVTARHGYEVVSYGSDQDGNPSVLIRQTEVQDA